MPAPTIVDKPVTSAPVDLTTVDLTAPVVEVVVLEDRAHVIRRGEVELLGGITRLRIAGVAPVLADKTLCASVVQVAQQRSDPSRERINDVRVRRSRRILAEQKPEQRRLLEEELAMAQRTLGVMRTRHAQLGEHVNGLDAVGDGLVLDIGVDVSFGKAEPEQWKDALSQVVSTTMTVRMQALELAHEIEDQEQVVTKLRQRLAATAQVSDVAVAEAIVEIWTASPGHYTVQVDYVVPGACWRPYHRAQLVELIQGQEPVLHFASEGCVWQNTGEDWHDVQLIFSTERPSLGTTPPQLTSEMLLAQRKSETLVVEARDQDIQTTGAGAPPRQRSAELPGIDDGGESLKLRSAAKASVAADGRPHRVPLMAFTSPTVVEHVLLPELAPAVLRKTMHVNRSQWPILAGPVDLVREGGFVGRSSLLYIAPGENFAIGWGPDGAFRVQRSVDLAKEDRGALSAWTTQVHRVKIKISNLGSTARTLQVSERVPVSEIEKLRIDVDASATTDRQRPDANGLVHWKVTLPAFGRQTLELGYTVRKHADVVGI